jgi:Transcriptional regulators containing a DNA-binding HTH domain and an aminotransferase domain (MocR family) and their eukaryotic orthologs
LIYVNIEKENGVSMIKQIYEQLRSMILKGEVIEGARLPSTRELAQILKISRNTVTVSYDMLLSEGLVFSRPGSGIYVSPGSKFVKEPEAIQDYSLTAFTTTGLSDDTVSFHSGTPALTLFPRNKWIKVEAQAFKEAPVSALGYDYPNGRPEFRNTLAAYLKRVRGINCHPDQILVTTGAKQGLTLIAKCLLNPQKEAWIEDPANENVRKIFSYHTSRITPIAVDQKGIQPELFPQDRIPALIFISPSHQFPMGGILPIQRRLELIRYAKKNNCYLVEDDYDSEFRYKGLPLHSLHELDSERVIYVGSFSKTLFPSVRLGYMVLPWSLIEPCIEFKRLGDHHSNSLNQLTAMRFIDSGELERHIMHMNKIYAGRREELIRMLKEYFPNKVTIFGEAAGLHIVAEFADRIFSPALITKLEEAGVSVIPVENHAMIKGFHHHQIILGYAHLDRNEMEKGLSRMKEVLSS